DAMISLPVNRLEPSAAVDAGLGEELARWFREGDSQLTGGIDTAVLRNTVWLVKEPLTADGAAALRERGVQLLVVPFDLYSELEGAIPPLTDTTLLLRTELPNGSSMPIAVVDPAMELLDPERDTGNTPAEDAVRLMATIAAIRNGLPADLRSMVLATPDLGVPDADVLVWIERFADEHPDVTLQPLAAVAGLTNPCLVGGEQLTVELADQPTMSIAERTDRVRVATLQAADVSSMLPADDDRPERWATELDTSLSTGLTAEEAAAQRDSVDAELNEVRDAVQPPEPFRFTVGGRDTEIPPRI